MFWSHQALFQFSKTDNYKETEKRRKNYRIYRLTRTELFSNFLLFHTEKKWVGIGYQTPRLKIGPTSSLCVRIITSESAQLQFIHIFFSLSCYILLPPEKIKVRGHSLQTRLPLTQQDPLILPFVGIPTFGIFNYAPNLFCFFFCASQWFMFGIIHNSWLAVARES